MDHMQIAETILSQLGAGKFKVMTGARDFLALPAEKGTRGGLSFNLPSRFAKDGVNHVKIILTPLDTYSITFFKRGPRPSLKQLLAGKQQTLTVISTHDDVYCDQLQPLFTRCTGLDTHL